MFENRYRNRIFKDSSIEKDFVRFKGSLECKNILNIKVLRIIADKKVLKEYLKQVESRNS